MPAQPPHPPRPAHPPATHPAPRPTPSDCGKEEGGKERRRKREKVGGTKEDEGSVCKMEIRYGAQVNSSALEGMDSAASPAIVLTLGTAGVADGASPSTQSKATIPRQLRIASSQASSTDSSIFG